MNKLVFLLFLSIFGCIKFERLKKQDKIFSYDDFRKLVKKEDIAEYLLKNEYDFKQELEQGRDILDILIKNDMEAEVLVLLDKLNTLKAEERVKFLLTSDGKILNLVVDKLWAKSAKKILDMYFDDERLEKLGFITGLNFTLIDRAVMNKNMQSLLLVLDLRREYAKEIKEEYDYSRTFKINKKLSELLAKTYDFVTARKADKGSELDKNIGEDSIFVIFLKECLKKKGIKGEVSVEEFLSNLDEKGKKEALIISSCLGDEKVLSYLLNLGIKQNEIDENGNTALIYSSYYGRLGASEILIGHGVDIDVLNNDQFTALLVASLAGNTAIVELLINNKANINKAYNNGSTPIIFASHSGHKEVVELLINKGAAIDLADENGWTSLCLASQNGHKEVVELLINKGAVIDLADEDGWTSLCLASQNGHKEVVELLLSKGASIDLADKQGATPLYRASYNGCTEVVELLIEKGAAIDLVDRDGITPLYVASRNRCKEVVELLINKGASIDLADKAGCTPLYIASSYGQEEVVKLLISKGADVNKVNLEGKSVLEIALFNGVTKVIDELLSSCFIEGKGIVLSSSGLIVSERTLNLFNLEIIQNEIRWLTIYFARVYRILNEIYTEQFVQAFESDLKKSSSGEFFEIIDKIRALKAINKSEIEKIDSIIRDSSVRSRYEIIDFLNKLFDTRSVLKENPIYNEFINSREVILNRRVKAGYYKDYTILMLEILKCDLDKVSDKVKDFIKKGADVNATDQSGNTCLMLAIRKDLKEVVELLITNGADVNAVNKSGENALMVAIEANSVDMVKRLAHLTDMHHEDIFKNTALMLAIKKIMRINPNSSDSEKKVRDIEEIVDILIKSGAKVTQEVIDLLEEKKGNEVVEKFRLRLARIFKLDF